MSDIARPLSPTPTSPARAAELLELTHHKADRRTQAFDALAAGRFDAYREALAAEDELEQRIRRLVDADRADRLRAACAATPTPFEEDA
jgi:hypothetical protein